MATQAGPFLSHEMNRDKSRKKILEKERLETVCSTSLMSFAQRGSLCLEPYTYIWSTIIQIWDLYRLAMILGYVLVD